MNNPSGEYDFVNPYVSLPQEQLKRTNTEIGLEDWNLLRSVRVKQGTFTTANNLLIWKLCHECRKRGWTDMSHHEQFERYVGGLVLVEREEYERLRDSSVDRISRQVDGSVVDQRTSGESNRATKSKARTAGIRTTKGK